MEGPCLTHLYMHLQFNRLTPSCNTEKAATFPYLLRKQRRVTALLNVTLSCSIYLIRFIVTALQTLFPHASILLYIPAVTGPEPHFNTSYTNKECSRSTISSDGNNSWHTQTTPILLTTMRQSATKFPSVMKRMTVVAATRATIREARKILTRLVPASLSSHTVCLRHLVRAVSSEVGPQKTCTLLLWGSDWLSVDQHYRIMNARTSVDSDYYLHVDISQI